MIKDLKCYECGGSCVKNTANHKEFWVCTKCKKETNSWGMPISDAPKVSEEKPKACKCHSDEICNICAYSKIG